MTSAAEVVLVPLDEETVGWGIELPTGRREPVYVLPCSSCGHGYRVSARTQREMRKDGRPPVCPMCRRPAMIQVTPTHCNYWLRRFDLKDIVAMAEAIWGPRDTWNKTTV